MASSSEQLCHHYSLADIQLATQNFNDRLVVGQGGFGKVYKGHIANEGSSSTTVAIKRYGSISGEGVPEFSADIETLSKMRHAHLVSLLGYCYDDKEMILVYEYMPHGTLYHHLHESNTPLSWLQRLKISIDAAWGLEYLHNGAGTTGGVLHCDVNSKNIVLGENWAAKISDFGLAKMRPLNQSSTYDHSCIEGKFGYMDPEIFLTGKFTSTTDVFAFGVVLFELLSGRQAVLPDGDKDLSLATWAQNCVKKRNLDQLVAVEMRGKMSPKSLKKFSQIAYRCLDSDPNVRPTMSEVVVALRLSESLQEKFENCAKPAGLFGFTWKISCYSVYPAKKTSASHGDKKTSVFSKNNSECSSSVPIEYNEVYLDNKQMHARALKIFSYTDLERATSKFKEHIINVGPHRVFRGWVSEKIYSPSKRGTGLAITVLYFEHRPKRELLEMGEFSHPNLQRLLGYCLEGEKFYLVHELTGKRSLKDYLEAYGPDLPLIVRVKIAIGVVRGLVFLHHKQLIEEAWSLSPDYIWIDKDFNAQVLYFDVARLVRREPISSSWSRGRQSVTRGFGILLLTMLAGKPMFTIDQIDLVIKKHLSGQICDMSDQMIRTVGFSFEEAMEDLKQIYGRMIRKIPDPFGCGLKRVPRVIRKVIIVGVQDVVDLGLADAKKNNIVKGLLFQSIPEDLVLQIKNFKTGKEMWKAIKTRNLGAYCVKKAWLQTLIMEFVNLKMSYNDTIDAYVAKLSGIASKSDTLGEVMSEHKLVKKFLTNLHRRYIQETIFINEEEYTSSKSQSNTDEDDVWYFDNGASNHMTGVTPYEKFYGEKPKLKDLKVFGCVAYERIVSKHLKKLDDSSKPLVYLVPATIHAIVPVIITATIQGQNSHQATVHNLIHNPQMPATITYEDESEDDDVAILEPRNKNEAKLKPQWLKAMKTELDSIVKNNIWKLVPLPKRVVPVGLEWLFKIKINVDGSIMK
ncbi:serine/threonine/dual specificity protein kinase, catalytic domain-containing protein [Tanacetum coccineum]